jgi:hypothetical protein
MQAGGSRPSHSHDIRLVTRKISFPPSSSATNVLWMEITLFRRWNSGLPTESVMTRRRNRQHRDPRLSPSDLVRDGGFPKHRVEETSLVV